MIRNRNSNETSPLVSLENINKTAEDDQTNQVSPNEENSFSCDVLQIKLVKDELAIQREDEIKRKRFKKLEHLLKSSKIYSSLLKDKLLNIR